MQVLGPEWFTFSIAQLEQIQNWSDFPFTTRTCDDDRTIYKCADFWQKQGRFNDIPSFGIDQALSWKKKPSFWPKTQCGKTKNSLPRNLFFAKLIYRWSSLVKSWFDGKTVAVKVRNFLNVKNESRNISRNFQQPRASLDDERILREINRDQVRHILREMKQFLCQTDFTWIEFDSFRIMKIAN